MFWICQSNQSINVWFNWRFPELRCLEFYFSWQKSRRCRSSLPSCRALINSPECQMVLSTTDFLQAFWEQNKWKGFLFLWPAVSNCWMKIVHCVLLLNNEALLRLRYFLNGIQFYNLLWLFKSFEMHNFISLLSLHFNFHIVIRVCKRSIRVCNWFVLT